MSYFILLTYFISAVIVVAAPFYLIWRRENLGKMFRILLSGVVVTALVAFVLWFVLIGMEQFGAATCRGAAYTVLRELELGRGAQVHRVAEGWLAAGGRTPLELTRAISAAEAAGN